MNDYFRMLNQIHLDGKVNMAIATIIRINGSSYRKEGAKMLFWEDGRRFGTISAGCLEDDLSIHALEVIKTRCGKIITYNLKDEEDLTWGVGCNGEIEIYIEPVLNIHSLLQIKNFINTGRKVISVKSLVTDRPPIDYLFSPNGELLWNESGMHYGPHFYSRILTFINSKQRIKILKIDGVEFLLEKIHPITDLYIFGAGIDAEPLAKLASELDFVVTVVDPRKSRCNNQFFPTADHLIIEHPSAFFQHYKLNDSSFVVIMNHHFHRDKQILESLSSESTAYIGILGSRKRTEQLLRSINKPIRNNVYFPIGLDIKAEGPEEISVSIMAEMILIRNQIASSRIP